MTDRTTIRWLGSMEAQALRLRWHAFAAVIANNEHPMSHAVARRCYMLGMLDALGITNPAAMQDAMRKITAPLDAANAPPDPEGE